MKLFLQSTLASVAFCSTAHAFDHADRTTLDAALLRYGADLEAERFDAADALRPPRLGNGGFARTDESADLNVIDVIFDLDRVTIETDATGLDYAVIPTTWILSYGIGQDTATDGLTVALQDTGRWYFLAIRGQEDVAALQAAYPTIGPITPPQFKDSP